MYPSISIIGAHNRSHPEHATPEYPWTPQRHAELYFDAVRHGALEVGRLVAHRRPYRDAPEVYAMLARDRSSAMGVLFEWSFSE